jgi:hypothetical protein
VSGGTGRLRCPRPEDFTIRAAACQPLKIKKSEISLAPYRQPPQLHLPCLTLPFSYYVFIITFFYLIVKKKIKKKEEVLNFF